MWSRILDTTLAEYIYCDRLNDNALAGCTYHNWGHVQSMYQYLEDTNEPYDECLDWAVLFHDAVYDKESDKELRSAELFMKLTTEEKSINRQRVYNLIMCTKDHAITLDPLSSAIIRADLHGLADCATTFKNFGLIIQESMALYNINEIEFAQYSGKFMKSLYVTVYNNIKKDLIHEAEYQTILKGILITLQLYRIVESLYT